MAYAWHFPTAGRQKKYKNKRHLLPSGCVLYVKHKISNLLPPLCSVLFVIRDSFSISFHTVQRLTSLKYTHVDLRLWHRGSQQQHTLLRKQQQQVIVPLFVEGFGWKTRNPPPKSVSSIYRVLVFFFLL